MSATNTTTTTTPPKMCKSPANEVLSTNCTLIGSNNLNLETKLGQTYATPKINICSKPVKYADVKKSPRQNYHQQLQQQQLQQQQIQQQILAAKNNFSPIGSPLNNGGYGANPGAPNYPQSAVSPYNVQISSPASLSGIKSPVASPQQIRPPTPQPILPQAFQQIPVMTTGANLVQIIHNAPGGYQNHHPVLARQTIIVRKI